MKNFEEKAIKNMSVVTGGAQETDIYLTVKIENLFDGIKGNTTLTPDAKITLNKK